jgi:hypothetical protein
MGKHFIDPKSSEICKFFPCTTQIALVWPKLLPALFDIPALLKSWQKHQKVIAKSAKLNKWQKLPVSWIDHH